MLHQSHQLVKAPELYGDQWFNSEPLSIHASLGQNILIFFWNYTSPASLRILPTIKEWFATYSEIGLVCIGVHAPEFSFAKDLRKVEDMIAKQSIAFPVVVDNERLITDAYRVSNFPAVVLIGPNGNIYDIVTHLYSFSRLERSIQYLLRQSGFFGELPMLQSIESRPVTGRNRSEINTGYLHGSLGNSEGYSPELPAEYHDPKIYVEGKFYAHGFWHAERNAFRYVGKPNEGYLVCLSYGNNIDALFGNDKKTSLRIMVDEALMSLDQMGADIRRDAKGNSLVTVDEPQFVSVFRAKNREQHAVKFIPKHSGTAVYKLSLYSDDDAFDEPDMIGNN